MTAEPAVQLNEFSKDEWWDVARILSPDLSREEYDEMWADFCEVKRRRTLQ